MFSDERCTESSYFCSALGSTIAGQLPTLHAAVLTKGFGVLEIRFLCSPECPRTQNTLIYMYTHKHTPLKLGAVTNPIIATDVQKPKDFTVILYTKTENKINY